MLRLFCRHAQPVFHKGVRHIAKAPGGIQRQVDSVEFDMRDSVQQRRTPLGTTQPPPWHIGSRHQLRARRPARCRHRVERATGTHIASRQPLAVQGLRLRGLGHDAVAHQCGLD